MSQLKRTIFKYTLKIKCLENRRSQEDCSYLYLILMRMAIESGVRKLGISGKEMHDRLSKQGLIQNRLIKRYEELHTQSLDWVADNISETFLNWEAGL